MKKRDNMAEVIVIGGGVIGCSIAYHLARQKVQVLLLERGGLASGSSGACDGYITAQSKKPGIHQQLALASLELYPALADELPLDMELDLHGCLVVIEGERELAAMREFVRRSAGNGLNVELLDTKQARELEPILSPDISGATFNRNEGQVNPIRLTLGLARGARELGARIMTGQDVVGLLGGPDKVAGVKTRTAEFLAEKVVNACGVLAPNIGAPGGAALPIKPRRGQLLVTEASPDFRLNHSVLSSRYIAAKFDPEIASQTGGGCAAEQTASGNFLLGSTREFVGHDTRTTLEGLRSVAERVSQLIPGLKAMKVIRSFAGLRPYTPDGLPVLDKAPGTDGLFVAAGHEGDGIALAPITGRLMAQLITGCRTDFPLDAFRHERFAESAGGGAA